MSRRPPSAREAPASTIDLPERTMVQAHGKDGIPQPAFTLVGDYEILGEIARGGMGVVYRARQKTVRRLVALKMILPDAVPNDEAIRRFRIEAEAVARLDHPNIVPIYEVGVHEGRAFFTMKLVEGGSLHHHAAALTANQHRAVEIMAQVARAVDYAHQRGILHRDLKPGNILLDEAGQPYLTDFGLAKHANRDSSLTESGAVIGTPSFMAPEQASGRAKRVTAAADIYGLGAIFYLLLAGRPPFHSEVVLEILRQVVDEEPERPSSINRLVDRDLEAIALKCLEKEPERRYASAGDLADDLESWLHQRPISARLATGFEQLVKWAKRKPVIATLTGALAVALIGGFAATFQQWREAEAARVVAVQKADDEAKAKREAVAQRQRAEEALTRIELERVEDYFERDNSTKAIEGLVNLLRRHPGHSTAVERLLSALLHRNFLQPAGNPAFHDGMIHRIQIHPDGRRALSVAHDETAKIWELADRSSQTLVLRHKRAIQDARFSSDGRRIVTGSLDRTAQVWNVESGERVSAPLSHPVPVSHSIFVDAGEHVATATMSGLVSVWHADSGRNVLSLQGTNGPINWLGVSPDGRLLVWAEGKQLRVWDWRTGVETVPPLVHDSLVWTASISPDGTMIAAGCRSGGATTVWGLKTGQALSPALLHQKEVNSVEFSPDGRLLLTASRDGTARLWSAASWVETIPALRHESEVLRARFSPDGSLIATACKDGTARCWVSRSGQAMTEPLRHTGAITALAFGASHMLLTGAQNSPREGVVTAWELDTNKPGELHLAHSAEITALTFDFEEGRLASGDRTGLVRVWDLSDGRTVWSRSFTAAVDNLKFVASSGKLAVHVRGGGVGLFSASGVGGSESWLSATNTLRSVDFSEDGKWIAGLTSSSQVKIWDASTGGEALSFPNLEGHVHQVVLSPGGRLVAASASASSDATGSRAVVTVSPKGIITRRNVRVWDGRTGRVLAGPPPFTNNLTRLRFNRAETKLLVLSTDTTVRVYGLENGGAVESQFEHPVFVRDAALSADGQRLFTGADDGLLRVWDVAGRAVVAVLGGQDGAVRSLFLTTDEQRCCVIYVDGRARIFDLTTGLPSTEWLKGGDNIDMASHSVSGQILAFGKSKEGIYCFATPARVSSQALRLKAWLKVVSNLETVSLVPHGQLETTPRSVPYTHTTQMKYVETGRRYWWE